MNLIAPFATPPRRERLPFAYRREALALVEARHRLGAGLDWSQAVATARPWVEAVRQNPAPFWAMESLLKEYPISSAEGLALMRLAEALLRVPDVETAITLTADQLGRADFDSADGSHGLLAGLSASAIALSKKFLPDAQDDGGLLGRLGARTVVAATLRAIQLLGRQFVLGRTIDEAMAEADAQRRGQAGLRFSYDMLGEGARTERDAERYLAAYQNAIDRIAATAAGGAGRAAGPEAADGISIKLSALFSRYEDAQRERVFAELLPRVWTLVERAAPAQLNLTIDAEEVDRLELSLDVFEALAERIAQTHAGWRGFGLAVQAYQGRALAVVDEVARIARSHGVRFMVRLVKGAYWDGEVKRAQEAGLPGYPVYTRKPHTDVSYLACARAMLGHRDVIYPQFATHNAGTIAALQGMARSAGAQPGADYEMQRLHGMGDGVYREVMKSGGMACRVYAPVGEHRDLLAYLVRRLLENGANSSFVHQLADPRVVPEELLASPLAQAHAGAQAEGLDLPVDLYGAMRRNSTGADLSCATHRAPLEAAVAAARVPVVAEANPAQISAAMVRLQGGYSGWSERPLVERAAIIRRAGDLLDARLADYCALLVKEAHKTLGDCVAEVREAVDFCRLLRRPGRIAPGRPAPARPDRRDEHAAPARPRRVRLHQPVELPAGDLCRPGGGGAGGGQHGGGQACRADPGRGRRHGGAAARSRRARGCTSTAARPGRDRGRGAGGRRPHRRRVLHRVNPGGEADQPRAGRQGRPDRAADCRDWRLERDAGRLHRAARAGHRRGGAERLPFGRPALFGPAPAVRARGHRRRRDRDAAWRAG